MRSRYLVSYDISNPKRWRKIYRKMRGFGDPLHYSVFRCDLSDSERILLVEGLTALMHHDEDRVLIIRLGPAKGRVQEGMLLLGRPLESGPQERIAVIV